MKAAFLTLGCKVNYYETEKMIADFKKHGFEVTDFDDDADVYIINTCTVTNIADRKSRKMIHRAKRRHPDSIVAAVGCYVESSAAAGEKDDAVDLVFLNQDKEHLAEKVISYLESAGIMGGCGAGEGRTEETEGNVLWSAGGDTGRTRRYIKVQDGCNQFCSYCMIPYVRGGGILSSREEYPILEEIRHAADTGYKEVVITGIHLSSFGVGGTSANEFVRQKGAPLTALLGKINGIDGIERIRMGSLEPRIICDEFLDGLSAVDKLCPHFHLSLQSGCDETLRRMNRHYTAEEYRESCDRIRSRFEHPAVTTDVIVGFPGETEEEFEKTRKFVNDIGLAGIHVFPYSVRYGTKAAKMDGQVSPEIKRRRADRLIADASALKAAYAGWFVGRTEKVLFEEVREAGGQQFLTGHNERYVVFGVPVREAQELGYRENSICPVTVQRENLIEAQGNHKMIERLPYKR